MGVHSESSGEEVWEEAGPSGEGGAVGAGPEEEG